MTPREERYGDRLYSHRNPGEADRLGALARVFDPYSFERLRPLATPGLRTCDVGAGLGTVAAWLMDACREQATVVDLDVRHLGGRGFHEIQADITEPAFTPGLFDLVHARFLLMHLRERENVLARMARWVRPGGWLVVSDAWDLGPASSPCAAYRETAAVASELASGTTGSDLNLGRSYPRPLAGLGFTEVGFAVDVPPLHGGGPLARFWSGTANASRPALVERLGDATVDEALAYLADPATQDLGIAMVTMWGRRP
ncbi:class I SAM-dependent methyltransferase [Streptacidiphilus anmyonensis]|uniref:class I SAM-dependent methyltransferase n=1 Tax=Streptacidiphilus anmyonensis TaxID=405782 RepID=UPI0005A6FD0B|nr:class I SAM-dependent methyltransferase [Streptacidiphilus anmyonensis]